MRSTDKSNAGFTLIETLIAFTVFSLFLIAVHKSFVFGLKAEATADWSDAIGQAVRSEFARVEAGVSLESAYRRDLWDGVSLKVDVVPLPLAGGDVPIKTGNLKVVKIRVQDQKKNPVLDFQKVVFMEQN
jgi:Tfp pilus assembly protein PilV